MVIYMCTKKTGGEKMQNALKLLISDERDEFNREYAQIFENAGFRLSFSPKDGLKVLDKIEEEQPDLVLMDLFMPHLDSIGVIRSMQRIKIQKVPLFFVKSTFSSPTLERELFNNGVSYFIVEPFQIKDLTAKMLELSGYYNTIEETLEENNVNHLPSLEIQVTEILHQIGVPAHIKGYHYLRDSIIMAIETPEIINAVTKQLYPSVAKRYETTSSRVERAIRHAIEVAWDRGDVDVLNSYFGYTIHNTRGKLTNSEFIAMISDKLRLQMKTAS